MRALVIVAVACVLVGGCAPTNMAELKQSAEQKDDFFVHRDYRDVYRTLLPVARKCWNVSGHFNVLGDLYTDQTRAEIAFEVRVLAQQFIGTVDIEQEGAGTRVRSYISGKSPLHIRAWATGSTDC